GASRALYSVVGTWRSEMGNARLLRYVLRRLLQAIPVILGVVVLNFLLLQLAPGNAATVLAGEAGGAPAEYVEALRQRFGLDKPVPVQLALYVKNILALDLGYSFRNQSPVLPLILARLSATLLLFWIGLMLILLFAIKLDWLPTSGMEDAAAFYEGWERIVDIARHLILPAITLSLFYMALYARLMRATMLEQRGLDYVTTARAKGLSERQITLRHVVRNALMPVVTVAGVQVGGLLGGSVVVESVFAWPGLGQLAFQALFARDLNLLLGIFFISSCLVVIVNLIIDVIYVILDPR